MSWFFEQYAEMGGASAGAYRNPLAGAGVPPLDVFVREILQNSVDAAVSGDTAVHVVIRDVTFSGEDKADLREALGLDAASPLITRQGLLPGLAPAEILDRDLRVLFVEDFDTVGLGGTDGTIEQSDEDNYRRLCLELGVSGQGESRGGTFGFGKAAYWAVSKLWTVVFYSRFNASVRTAEAHSRLIGVSWLNEHAHQPAGHEYPLRFTGRAWFGHADPEARVCLPFVNQEADELAARLGFSKRDAGQTGTSAMILAHEIDADRIRDAVERNWWPRILEEKLNVDLPDGTTPSPRSNGDLRPMIHCWDLLRGTAKPGEANVVRRLSYRRNPLGTVAITASEDIEFESRRSQVALVRGPGMIVTIEEGPAAAPSQPVTLGVFLADPVMEEALAASEPPNHDRWDADTTRTDRPLDVQDRQRIRKIREKIRGAVNDFLRAHQEPPPSPPPRCSQLEKILGSYLATQQAGPKPPPPRDPDIFSIQFKEQMKREIHEDSGEVRLSAVLELAASDEAFAENGETEIVVRVTSWVDLLLDDGHSAPRSERLMMTYMKCDDPKDQEAVMGKNMVDGTVAELLMCPDEDAWMIELLSDPLPHPEYAAKLRLVVEKEV